MARFLSLNVNGLRDVNKRMSLLQWLSHLNLDFVCLQETHVVSHSECLSWFSSYGFLTVASPGSPHSCGSVILYRSKYHLVKTWSDSMVGFSGRFVMAEFQHHDVSFRLACIYAPNRNPERNDFFAYCESIVDPSVPALLCGDFNAVFDRTLDRRGSNVSDLSHESCQTLRSLFENCCVADVWRLRHPRDRGFSWCKSDRSLAFRIDLIGCCPFPWLHHVVSCEMVFCPYSDHSAVLLDCPIPSPLPRGPGRWKLNVSILSNAEFVVAVKRFWSTWRLCKSSFRSLQSWWDRGKEELRGLAVRFCCAKSQNLSSSRSLLTNLSNHLKWKIDQGFDSLLSILENVSAKIAELVLHEAEGAKVRSRIKWAEEGEASTSYFLRLEKKNGSDGWISAMKNADGSLATDISSICDSWVAFYSSLFSACDTEPDTQEELLQNLSSFLSPDQSQLCDGYLTADEVLEALKGMARGKSPGSDGLPVEFYLTFWDLLGDDLVEVLNASFDAGLLPFSQRGALITLIHKKGHRLLHKNWRPISLLNIDYKICAKALAGRLLKVLQFVIHPIRRAVLEADTFWGSIFLMV